MNANDEKMNGQRLEVEKTVRKIERFLNIAKKMVRMIRTGEEASNGEMNMLQKKMEETTQKMPLEWWTLMRIFQRQMEEMMQNKPGESESDETSTQSQDSSCSDIAVAERTILGFPGKYNVVFYDDDETPIKFVIEILMKIFGYEQSAAVETTLKIQQEGRLVVGTYIKSVAEAKITLVKEICEKTGYPLNVTMEKE